MNIKIKEQTPIYKHKIKPRNNWWMYAAVLGLIGTWISGAIIEQNSGTGSYSLKVELNIMSTIITLLWFGILYHAIRSNKLAKKKFMECIKLNNEYLEFNDDGIIYGIKNVYEIKTSWSVIGYYSINKTELELGTPSNGINIDVSELDNFDLEEFTKFMEEKNITKY